MNTPDPILAKSSDNRRSNNPNQQLPKKPLLECRRCRRLTHQFKKLKQSHPDYWNQPVAGNGEVSSRLMIVGLAPGMHGANKTGIPFTGDASGDLLYDVLTTLNLDQKVFITNAVKCLPVANLPTGKEVKNCSPYLLQELMHHADQPNATVLALGGVAHRAIISTLGYRQKDFSFGHGNRYELDTLNLIDSFHCSRYNTQTGRLTREMFLDVVQAAGNMAYP